MLPFFCSAACYIFFNLNFQRGFVSFAGDTYASMCACLMPSLARNVDVEWVNVTNEPYVFVYELLYIDLPTRRAGLGVYRYFVN